MCQVKGVVGVFSRDHASCYEWLIDFLLNSSLVRDVHHVYITNKTWNLKQEIRHCTFGILYHSKTRGRLNITDVTDSLYDEELRVLSEILGRKNVIVVVDHVEDGGEEEKNRILKAQPSIGSLALDLILVTKNENVILTDRLKTSESTRKHQQIRRIIRAHNKRLAVTQCWNLKCLVVALLIILALALLGSTVWLINDFHHPNRTLPIEQAQEHA